VAFSGKTAAAHSGERGDVEHKLSNHTQHRDQPKLEER
jgi:hypothetical protein